MAAIGLGFLGAVIGAAAVGVSTWALGLQGDWVPSFVMGGFFLGMIGGILGSERLLAPSGKALVLVEPFAAVQLSNSEPRTDADELLELVRSPLKAPSRPGLFYVAAFIVFWWGLQKQGWSLGQLAIVVGVLLFHETGHALGMKVFGYRDVRVFFIPYFGAATSGTPKTVSAWREGIVLLLGPLPGIVLGTVLLLGPSGSDASVVYAARMLLIINAFNLLPVLPLDGGRLLELAFGRQRVAEAALRAVSAIALAWLALALKDYVLGFLAFLQAVGAHLGWRISTLALGLEARDLEFPERCEDATPELVSALNRRLWSRLSTRPVATRAAVIRLAIERAIAARNPLGGLASAALLGAWASGIVLALLGFFQWGTELR